jgi:hypothetical protein
MHLCIVRISFTPNPIRERGLEYGRDVLIASPTVVGENSNPKN